MVEEKQKLYLNHLSLETCINALKVEEKQKLYLNLPKDITFL